MTHSINSSVKVWIWESSHTGAAPEYGHVALEMVQSERTRYISFCVEPNCKFKPLERTGYNTHFHENKEADDSLQSGKKARCYCLYFLDTSKINAAFKRFKANPNAWGALGWGLWDRAYSLNACGLTAYLLDKGQIFHLPVYQNVVGSSSIAQRIVNGIGSFFAVINYWIAYQCRSIVGQLKGPNQDIKLYATSFKAVSDEIYSSTSKISDTNILEMETKFNQVSEELNRIQQADNLLQLQLREAARVDPIKTERLKKTWETVLGILKPIEQNHIQMCERLENLKEAKKLIEPTKLLRARFNVYPWEEKHLSVENFMNTTSKVGNRFLGIGVVTTVALVVFCYINNRFIAGRYDARDIVLLAERAVHAEKLEGSKIAQVMPPPK